jgi:hypothetical protein
MKTVGNPKGRLQSLQKRWKVLSVKAREGNDALHGAHRRCEGTQGAAENTAEANIERWLSSPGLRRPR